MNELDKNVAEPQNMQRNRKFDLIALIVCLIVSVSIWLYVENTNQGIVEKEIIVTFNAEEQIFDETGMYIFSGNKEIDYSQVEVKLTVSGPKSLLEKYDDSEYVVELDTSRITQAGGLYSVFLKCKLPHEEIEQKSIVATAYTSSLVLIDHKAEKKVDLLASYEDVPAKKDSVITCTPKTDSIFVSGPASMVSEINSVVAMVSVSSLEESTTVKTKNFELFGEDGSPILLDESYITLTPSEVDVDVAIKYVNAPVSIRVEPKTQDTDEYIYEAFITLESKEDVTLFFDGDSAYFPDNSVVVLNLEDLSKEPIEKVMTVEEFINSSCFDNYRDHLTLSNVETGKLKLTITIRSTSKQISS